MHKRGQGLPLEMIIIAALVLVVLFSVLYIYFGKAKAFKGGLESCEASGYVCVAGTDAMSICSGRGGRPSTGSCAQNYVCCTV